LDKNITLWNWRIIRHLFNWKINKLMSSTYLRTPHRLTWLPLKAIGLFCGMATANVALADIKQTLDWVPLSQLSDEQKQQLPLGSCGAYISPLANQDTSIDLSNEPTETSSNKSEIVEKDGFKEITLIGDVIVKQGYQKLTAEQAIYSEQTGTITINGKLTVRQPDLLFIADQGIVNQQKDTLEVDDATYVIHSASIRGKGKHISKSQERIELTSSEYTYCEPGNNDWALKGSTIVIDTEKNQGTAKNVRLLIKGIPVFYWPYLRFPVGDARQSGFLFPTLSLSGGAIDVSVPYYFNVAPNYDLVFTPHFLQDHGTLFEANARHLNTHFETDINLSHLSNDSGTLSDSEEDLVQTGTATAENVNPFAGTDRWSVGIQQEGGLRQRWFSKIDYNAVSDNDYLEDFGSDALNSTSEVSLKQQITAGYQFDHWRLEVNNQQFQTLDDNITKPFKQLPEINFDGEYINGNWNTRLENEWVRFDHSNADDIGDTTLVGDRTRLKYSIELDNSWDAGFLRPRLQTQYLGYALNDTKLSTGANSNPSIIVPQAIIDSGLYFDRDGSGYQQTFEPRLFYFYSPHKNQTDLTGSGRVINFDTANRTFRYNQLFTDTRFSGSDRIDDANQLSIGLTSRFIGATSGREILSARIGKALYFEEREVTLSGQRDTDNNSPIAALVTANINEHWAFTNDTIYDDDSNDTNISTTSLKYRDNDSRLINFTHRFVENLSEQAEVSFILPFNSNDWSIIGHYNYDYKNNRDLEQLLGFEYHSCCYRLRFAFKRFIDDDQFLSTASNVEYEKAAILEFQFFGLGGTGKQFDKLLDDAIDGYEQWQATYR
jgi:LPS-assembly protein